MSPVLKMITDKSAHLLTCLDLNRPELDAVRAAANPTAAFAAHLARSSRPRFRFEYERKPEALAYLENTYASWRKFDTSAADRIAGFTFEQAQGARALSGVAELGRAWWATGNPAYGAAFERFYASVPTGDMFNWGSFNGAQGALELDAFFLLLDCPGFTAEGRVAFLDHLHAIAEDAWDDKTSRWLQLGLGPEGHNWYLHGTQVLPFIGLLFPEFKRAPFFIRTGASIFEEHLRGHYRTDGGARETTLGYQVGSMHSLWDFYLIAQRNGFPLSPQFADRLLDATRFLLNLMTPDGAVPSFGDTYPTPGQLTTLAATAAALTGDGACKWFAERCRTHVPDDQGQTPGQIPYGAFWRVGLAGAATYAETRASDPNLASVLLGPTGYAALRSSTAPDAHYLAVAAADRGPIVTSHGHNDVFSLDVHALGRRFIGEMGCAPYGDSPGRQYDQKTEAHSCLAIDGMEQAPLAGEWRWRGHVIPAVRRWITTPTHDFFHGVHEGYYRYPEHRTLHARKILFVKSEPQYWIIFDWIESGTENDVSAYFHGCVAGQLNAQTILLGQAPEPRLAIFPPEGDDVTAEVVSNDGLTAYIQEKNLDPATYPCFAYRKRTTSDCLVWALVPLAAGVQPPRLTRLPVTLNGKPAGPHEVAAVQLAFAGQTDTICLSHTEYDAELVSGPVKTWGIFAFNRTCAGGSARPLDLEHTVRDGVCGR
jgi:hypothetical protein